MNISIFIDESHLSIIYNYLKLKNDIMKFKDRSDIAIRYIDEFKKSLKDFKIYYYQQQDIPLINIIIDLFEYNCLKELIKN